MVDQRGFNWSKKKQATSSTVFPRHLKEAVPCLRLYGITNGDATPGPPDLLSPEVLRSMPLPVARFFLHQPRDPPRWRTSPPPDGMDDGAWVAPVAFFG